MLFGLAGGVLSLLAMALLRKFDIFSVTGVSIAGGAVHNLGQLLVAAFVISNFAALYYLPVLLISGAVTGAGTGLAAGAILGRLTKMKRPL
jgi:heptaprenyl diphosphate synthase